jgi:cell division septation protein DedD
MRRSARIAVASLVALIALAGCSREKIDWKSAEAADTVESYDHFIERHPDSALATQARTRVAQLNEDRDWKKATAADTADAYRQFLSQHESGKWAEEARIRIENFSLDGTATGPAKPAADAVVAAPATAPAAARASKEEQVLPPAAVPAKPAAATPSATAKPAVGTPSAAVTAKPAAPVAQAAFDPKRVAAATPTPGAKPAAPPSTPPSPDPFGIQLGAFRSQDAALKNWKQLQVKYEPDLHGLFAHAVPVKQGSGELFRLQVPVGDEARARAICASLAKQSQPCVVVLPTPK